MKYEKIIIGSLRKEFPDLLNALNRGDIPTAIECARETGNDEIIRLVDDSLPLDAPSEPSAGQSPPRLPTFKWR